MRGLPLGGLARAFAIAFYVVVTLVALVILFEAINRLLPGTY